MSSTTVVTEKTVSKTTEGGVVTETTTSIEQVNGSDADGGAAAADATVL